ncbi:MAG: helix-turn-helix domain-containing protein [Lachnospiraceae bacterium]|nr:helix-turn-helix domain-containing protein [Lachnospiraceae bacterium]
MSFDMLKLERTKMIHNGEKVKQTFSKEEMDGRNRKLRAFMAEAEKELIGFAERELNALIEYDRKNGTGYLKTYRQYLYSDGNLTETSDALYIHRNTLIKRLKKIEILLEKDIRDPFVKTEGINAFFVLDYYGTSLNGLS